MSHMAMHGLIAPKFYSHLHINTRCNILYNV